MFLQYKGIKLNTDILFNRDDKLRDLDVEDENTFDLETVSYEIRGRLIDIIHNYGYLSKEDVNKYANWKNISIDYFTWDDMYDLGYHDDDDYYDLKRMIHLKLRSNFLKSI